MRTDFRVSWVICIWFWLTLIYASSSNKKQKYTTLPLPVKTIKKYKDDWYHSGWKSWILVHFDFFFKYESTFDIDLEGSKNKSCEKEWMFKFPEPTFPTYSCHRPRVWVKMGNIRWIISARINRIHHSFPRKKRGQKSRRSSKLHLFFNHFSSIFGVFLGKKLIGLKLHLF